MPEFIDPVFTKTSPKRSFSLNRKRAFWLVFAKTGSIISGTDEFLGLDFVVNFVLLTRKQKNIFNVLKNTVYCAAHEMHYFNVNLTGPQQYSTAGYFQKNFYKLCCITQRKKGLTITVKSIEESDRYYQLLEHLLPT